MPESKDDSSNSSPKEPGLLTTFHVQRAVGGDTDSLAWVVRRLSPLLLAQAAYRLGPQLRKLYDPEDLVNDAWLVALPRLAELPARDGRHTPVVLKFLTQTLLYRIQNLLKKHIKGKPVQQSSGMTDDPQTTDPLHRLPSDSSGVVTLAVRNEMKGSILESLDELEDKDREVILMRGIEQLSNQTAALQLGITPQAVAMRYHRALQRLRAKLPGSIFDELEDE